MFYPVLLTIPIAGYGLLLLGWHLLRRVLLSKNSGLLELPLLAKGRSSAQKIPGTAVICGGSIAGLLAARVCHDHFERVLVVETEPWVSSEDGSRLDGWNQTRQRSRVMQFTSLHMSQSFVYEAMKYMFPNLEEECRRSDISIAPYNPHIALSGACVLGPRSYRDFPRAIFASRMGTDILQAVNRRLVLDKAAYPDIEFLTGTVNDVKPNPTDHSRLSTVVVRTESGIQEVEAALVADCTGPARAGLKWLQRHGYGLSNSSTYPSGALPLDQLKISIDQKLRYTSITFNDISPERYDSLPWPPHLPGLKRRLYSFSEDGGEESIANGRRVFMLLRGDGQHLCVFAGHYGTRQPQPNNMAEMKMYIRGMNTRKPMPDWIFKILDMLEEHEVKASVSALRVGPTTYVQYHRAVNLPSNYVALGDSVMNGIEGAAKATRCALSLHKTLYGALKTSKNALPTDFSIKFFSESYNKTDWTWQNTRIADYGMPTTEPIAGESLSSGAFMRRYGTHMQRLSTTDELVGWAMYNIIVGMSSPIDALHPHIVLKVLWSMFWSR
ncbi:hypothetical protein R3P38DRAFT_2859936 [Favolaschia claudopus]|uniref:FAD/NAD(P)-binding domain-containing protein n=1 Tax=Favolaschia claudopus TaxID=2862362 RepID=A0AAW0DPC9_9AGAR